MQVGSPDGHRVVVTSGTDRAAFDISTGTPTPTAHAGIAHGWECLDCFRAEAPHYHDRALAQEAANNHAHPLTTGRPLLADEHLALVVQSHAYTVIEPEQQAPARGLGFGWECLLCHRAEAAIHPTADDARRAADRHQRARPGDLLTLNQFLDKLYTAETHVFGILDHDTREVRAFALKASPEVNDLIQRITAQVPPPPHGHNRN